MMGGKVEIERNLAIKELGRVSRQLGLSQANAEDLRKERDAWKARAVQMRKWIRLTEWDSFLYDHPDAAEWFRDLDDE